MGWRQAGAQGRGRDRMDLGSTWDSGSIWDLGSTCDPGSAWSDRLSREWYAEDRQQSRRASVQELRGQQQERVQIGGAPEQPPVKTGPRGAVRSGRLEPAHDLARRDRVPGAYRRTHRFVRRPQIRPLQLDRHHAPTGHPAREGHPARRHRTHRCAGRCAQVYSPVARPVRRVRRFPAPHHRGSRPHGPGAGDRRDRGRRGPWDGGARRRRDGGRPARGPRGLRRFPGSLLTRRPGKPGRHCGLSGLHGSGLLRGPH